MRSVVLRTNTHNNKLLYIKLVFYDNFLNKGFAFDLKYEKKLLEIVVSTNC